MKTVIMIGHRARQGKDTAAAILHGLIPNSEIMSFAEPLKQIIADTFDVSVAQLEKWKNDGRKVGHHYMYDAESVQTYRNILQRFGTEAMKKQFGEAVWADLMVQRIYSSKAGVIIIPDFRFRIEWATVAVQPLRVETVQIVRDGGGKDNHASETELDGFAYGYTVENTGTLDDLKQKLTSWSTSATILETKEGLPK